ncbi:DUF4251 domain-containing protein [uncultured Draconibacterium sp.]|uniref:DUF4251 domain-containing protein n=1 Tax=uncultured Draconibacterium sp. TaxID=1573823 RepID=UPI0029BFC72C|nr:DUF4251 domain-containing protein [uncultured Draconibacterium sp.]
MKKIILLSFLILSIAAVNAQDKELTRKEKKAQREAMLTEQTKQLVETNEWQFYASQMIPANGRSRNLSTPYSVVLQDETVDSYLPYIGEAYTSQYGSNESPLIFEKPVEDYSIEDAKKDGYTIKFSAKNNNDKIDFTFYITKTGSASLRVTSINRQSISYHGELVPVEEKENL